MTTIDGIELDALLSEKVVERVQTTDHPVEKGVDPTDHVRILPLQLTLECVLTNTPIPEAARNARGEAAQGATTGYAQRTYEKIRALKAGRAIVVQTPARRYENMQVVEIARSRDSSLGTDTIQFTVQFKEIVIVSTETVALERVSAPTAISKKPTGLDKQAKQVTTAEDGSWLKGLTDGGKITTAGDGLIPRGF